MKKFLIAIVAIILGSGVANAEFRFGVKAGLLINKLSFNKEIFDSNNSCGWTAGAMAEFTVPLIGLNFDAGVMYARMNNASNVQLANSSSASGIDNDLYGKNFIEIPVNIKYKFNIPAIASVFKPYVFTGPNFAFRVDKSFEDVANNLKSRTCQIAWNVGIGFELIKHLQISGSYGFGINNIVDTIHDTGSVNLIDSKAKNNYWTVSAAYLF